MDLQQVELYQLVEGTEIVLSCEDGSDTPCAPGVRTVFQSSTNGVGKDNPSDPNNLTVQQKKRSVSMTLTDTSCWRFTYDHYCPVDQPGYTGSATQCKGYTGGNFLFAGESEELIEEGECLTASPTSHPTSQPTTAHSSEPTSSPTSNPTSSPTSKPTSSPTSKVTSGPTSNPTSSPTSRPTSSPTSKPTSSPSEVPSDVPSDLPSDLPSDMPSDVPSELPSDLPSDVSSSSPSSSPTDACDGIKLKDSTTKMDFHSSTLTVNTLHEPGGELRYSHIGWADDVDLDLVVTVYEGDYTDIADVWVSRNRGIKNGYGPEKGFGNINLQTVQGKPKSGEGNFEMCFVQHGTYTPVTIEQFSWTFYDLDQRSGGIEEKFSWTFYDLDQR